MKIITLALISIALFGCSNSKDSSSTGINKGWFSTNKMFFPDTGTDFIREVDLSTGVINTFAGTGTGSFSPNGTPAASAQIDQSTSLIAIDDDTVIFINSSACVQMIDNGVVSKIAGDCTTPGTAGDGGLAVNAQLNYPLDLCMDSNDDLYIASYGAVRKVNMSSGLISTVVGTGVGGSYQPSHEGQLATSVPVNDLSGCAFDKSGNLYIAALDSNVIYKVTKAGVLTTITQTASPALQTPAGIDIDLNTNTLYFGDGYNNCFRTINLSSGAISTYLGECAGSNPISHADGTLRQNAIIGAADSIQLHDGKVYYSTYYEDFKIHVINNDIISTFVGNGTLGNSGDGGQATSAQIHSPRSILYYWD